MKKMNVFYVSDLQEQLKPLYGLKSEIASLKAEVSKTTLPKFFTIAQVCEILKISRSTTNRMIKNGDLKAKKAYRRVLIPEESINEFIKKSNLNI
ncbi:helix-turn-helix domain-containing protein [Segatella oulorum]|uniref:helix-turn-helix domain-containing protein n=1 Tax=Segatella oulorum TaxID=28136 RepID=UPI0028E66C21|nr:helix-turn-helix domain-containing protein [Segatella oulorum]